MSSGTRVFEYIKMAPTIERRGDMKILHGDIAGNVKFDNVKFSYPTRPEQTVLEDFSLDVPKGKVVALCGPSGSGL